MTDRHYIKARDILVDALMKLETPEECAAFLDDICTIRELSDLAQRWEVAEMLNEGKNYQEISAATGASTATISRVNKCLNYGSGGYRTLLNKSNQGETP
ncbi:MAG: TrpR-like protein YerC/YecD [Clostridia bacterium]|nr:TrpR-like protein YerC/YecD [Clostridia bacterium]